ncbi:AMP-binding protein [Streptomyces sp. NPDC016172]|uniref:AMP-binding protein n=1 Tax=Streptomyces sp. NPDC016172 TaxID=3364964 RepID=UPI0036F9F286
MPDRTDRIIGICLQRSTAQLVAALGILKSGAAYLPLDPGHSKARLTGLVADATTPIVLTDATTFALFDGEVLLTGAAPDGPYEAAPEGPYEGPSFGQAELNSDSLAYLIHTSGPTGRCAS